MNSMLVDNVIFGLVQLLDNDGARTSSPLQIDKVTGAGGKEHEVQNDKVLVVDKNEDDGVEGMDDC